MVFSYSLDRGETWTVVVPEEAGTAGTQHLVEGENTLTINASSKDIMLRIDNYSATPIDCYQEIGDISIIYREKTLR